MSGAQDTLYLLLEQNTEVTKRDVYLSDVATLTCTDPSALSRIRTVKVLKIPPIKKFRKVLSVMEIISEIQKLYPGMSIENLGDTNYIVTYVKPGKRHPVWDRIKTILISVVIFFGSAFSIMAFNNDVDVPSLFAQVYEQVMGVPSDGYTVLELSYSIGLSVGIIVFFNHFMGKKLTMDPTPIEVQMKLYEKDINNTLIDESSRKGKGINDAENNTSGS